MCEFGDTNLLFKLSTLYISIPILLFGMSGQFVLLSSFHVLEVAECAKLTPTMNSIIEALSKKTDEGDIEAILIANNQAGDLNSELNQFKKLRDHEHDDTKSKYLKLWKELRARNPFVDDMSYGNDPRSFVSQSHRAFEVLKLHGIEGV